MSNVSKKLFPLVILIQFIITVVLAYKLNIWVDEGFSLRTTDNDLSYALNQALYLELQPPLYYILLNLWRNLNSSIFFARLFSVFSMSLCVYLAGKLSACYLKKIQPGWMAAILAFNPFSIWAATEIRCYALVILLTVLLLYFFYKGYFENNSNYFERYIYLILAVFALYTHYYLGFLLFANAFALLYMGKWISLRRYLLGMITVSIGFSPIIFIIINQVSNHPGIVGTDFSVIKSLIIVGFRILIYIIPINKNVYFSTSYYEPEFLYYIPVCIIFSYIIAKNFKTLIHSNSFSIFIILSILFVLFSIVHQISAPELFLMRHTTVLFVPALFFAFSVVSKTRNKKLFYFVISAIFLIYANSLFISFRSLTKIGDYERVSAYIMKHEKNSQPILVFRSEMAIPLGYYYSGRNSIVPIPVSHIPTQYKKQALQSEKEIVEILLQIDGKNDYFWLVSDSYPEKYLYVYFNRHILEEFLEKNCVIIKSKQFYASVVRLVKIDKKLFEQEDAKGQKEFNKKWKESLILEDTFNKVVGFF